MLLLLMHSLTGCTVQDEATEPGNQRGKRGIEQSGLELLIMTGWLS
jgi:hypothetical protein